MHPDDAVNLLQQVSHIDDQNQTEEVAKVLEYQPLALAAAAYYVKTIVVTGSPNYLWKDYLDALSHGKRKVTEELLAKENIAYSKTTTTAIQMAIMRALEGDEVLREVLYLFSLCASESLPMEVAVDFYSEAKEYGEKALNIRIESYGEHHCDVAESYSNLGNVYLGLDSYTEAKKNYEKALIIRKEIYGEPHGEVATCYNNLGCVYLNLSQYSEAKEYYEKALIMNKEIYGDQHRLTEIVLDNLKEV
ncbi:unnamed protein product, partial [Porites lobata]